jgi:DNA invertase Pin-like site-specific DNA recombinase
MSEKLRARHLERPAIIYVRQSSHQQLVHNLESRRLQYAMEKRVRNLGWQETEIIDEDQGRSAATAAGRTGFQRMVAEVCLGRVGAVAAIEVSRFARNNRDWHQLVEMCGLVETLLIDHEAIYDPRHPNDRLLLGLKGSMSEYELDLLRQRSLEARLAKARRGELVILAPVGFVKTVDQRLEKDPNLRVQHAIELIFTKFFELGSARQVAMWLIEHRVDLPARRSGPLGWETWWRRPAYRNVISVLKEPTYAGAYAYGRTKTRAQVVNGELLKTRVRKPLVEWTVLIPEHHGGYISWEEFERIQKVLENNGRGFQGNQRQGAPKRGAALLSGLLRCRRCGRKLMVTYSGKNASVPRYQCHRGRLDNMEAKCISFGGTSVDDAVSREVLHVVRPGAVEAAVLAVAQESQQRDELVEIMLLELKAARYAVDLARRQYDAADPDNRLVTAELERRWNVALQKARELETKVEREQSRKPAQPPDPADLGDLEAALEDTWHAPETDVRLKKRIIRALVEEILVEIDTERSELEIVIHWKGGVHSVLRVLRRRRCQGGSRTSESTVEAVRQLAYICKDKAIAGYLNRNGILTAHGNRWSSMAVTSLRNKRKIPVCAPEEQRAGQWINLTEAAVHLGVASKTLRRAVERGDIQAMHPLQHGPWVFDRADLDDPTFRERLETSLCGKTPPAGPTDEQLPLFISTTYRVKHCECHL